MAKTNITIEVEGATYELAQALAKAITDIAMAVKAGHGTVVLSVSILEALVADVAPYIGDFSKLSEEEKESLPDFMAAWVNGGIALWKGLKA